MATSRLRRLGALAAAGVVAATFAAAPAAAKPSSGASQSIARAPGSGSGNTGSGGGGSGSGNGGGGSSDPATSTATSCQPPKTGFPSKAEAPWPQQRLNFREAWPITTGQHIRVGVVDSGIDQTQPQIGKIRLSDPHNVLPSPPFAATNVDDCIGHGTAVAGIIAAPVYPNSSFVGVAPDATIVPVKQANETSGDYAGTVGGLAAGIDWAVDHDVQVVNVSIETSNPDDRVEAAIKHAASKGVIIVAAAGNDAQTTTVQTRAYPAAYAKTYDNVIAVSAVDQQEQIGDFSEVGGYVTVCAPGVGITAPALRSGYTELSGTSFAAPYVTGTIALMLAADRNLTPAQVKQRLISTADAPPRTVPDAKYGWGIVNPYRAVTAVSVIAPSSSATRPAPLSALAAPVPPDHSTQHLAMGLAAGMVLLAGFLLAAWALARRRRTALHLLHRAPGSA